MPRRSLYQPALERTIVPIAEVVEDIRVRFLPEVPGPVPVFFATHDPLACAIDHDPELAFPAVYYHQVLNHPETPLEVLQFIAKHELLHYVVKPIQIGRRWEHHPDEFWEMEDRIGPEGRLVWAWLWANLHTCLKRRTLLREIYVTRRWRELEFAPRLPFRPSELQFHLQTDISPRNWRRKRNIPLRRGPARPVLGQSPLPA
ncbi:MAG: hypothetical protein ACM3S1_17060 [Hyphomicrobiales bacterium]